MRFSKFWNTFPKICLGPLARESPCSTDHKEGEQLEDRRNVGESSCNFGEFDGEKFDGEEFDGEKFDGEEFDGEKFDGEEFDGE